MLKPLIMNILLILHDFDKPRISNCIHIQIKILFLIFFFYDNCRQFSIIRNISLKYNSKKYFNEDRR